MSTASQSTLVSSLVAAAIVGFLGGAMIAGGGGEEPASAAPGPSTSSSAPAVAPSTTTAAPTASTVTLQTDTPAVPPGGRINLTGAIDPAVGGVTLNVQRRLPEGDWENFGNNPVVVTTKGDGTFSTYVQTGRTGTIDWRVAGNIDGTDVVSDVVTVTIG